MSRDDEYRPRKSAEPRSDLPDECLCVLPAQFYGRRARGQSEGEFRLLSAVLQDAIYRYLYCRGKLKNQQRAEFFEVEQWFQDKTSRELFSFESVCELLGIDAEAVRNCVFPPPAEDSGVSADYNPASATRGVSNPRLLRRRADRGRAGRPQRMTIIGSNTLGASSR